MSSRRFAAAALAVVALSACSTATTKPSSASDSTAAPTTTVLSKELILGRLQVPVLEPFSAKYHWGGPRQYPNDVVVVQDSELNLSYTIYHSDTDNVPVYEVILHDSTVYVRLSTQNSELAAEIRRSTGVPSGEWFPFEEWRVTAAHAAEDWDYPTDYSSTRLALSLAGFNRVPYEARVLASHAKRTQQPDPTEACFRVDRDFVHEGDVASARPHVRRTAAGRWVIDGPCYLSVVFDDRGRMTSLTGSDDDAGSENEFGYGVLEVEYGPQPAITAPDTSWFNTNKSAIAKAVKASAAQVRKELAAEQDHTAP